MLNRMIERGGFQIVVRNENGDEVTINSNKFTLILKTLGVSRVLHDCYATITESSNCNNYPLSVNYGNTEEYVGMDMYTPTYSFDVYPRHWHDVATVPEPEKEDSNIEEPIIDETEKLHNNLVFKSENK